MPELNSSKLWILMVFGTGILFLILAIAAKSPIILILDIIFLLIAAWLNQNEIAMGFDPKGVLLEKSGNQFHIPYEEIEWLSEIKFRRMNTSICYLGFKKEINLGTKVMFITKGHEPIAGLLVMAEMKGVKIRYIKVF